jgi:hypothetical protein
MINFKEYLIKNGTPALKKCLKKNYFKSTNYEYRLIYSYILVQTERIATEISFLTDTYEEELDRERGGGYV